VTRRARRLVAAAAVGSLLAVLACDGLLGLDDPTGALSSDAGAADATSPRESAPPDSDALPSLLDHACPVGQTSCAGLCVDLASDSNNCGACGRVCVAPCEAGLCQPVQLPLPGPGPVRGIASSGNALYAVTDDEVFLSSFDPDGPGYLPPFVSVYATDGGTLRSLAAVSGNVPTVAVAVSPGDALLQLGGASPLSIAADAGDPLSLASTGGAIFWASSDPSATSIMGLEPQGSPSSVATLQPGDDPCSLFAGIGGVYWTSARGTFVVPLVGGIPVAVTQAPFDNSVASADGQWAIVADSFGNVTLVGPTLPPLPVPVPGYVNAVAAGEGHVYLAGDGIYALTLPDAGATPVVTLLAVGDVVPSCHVPVLAVIGDYLAWVDAATGTVRYVTTAVPVPMQ
jgi:hypothetical protein